MLERKIDQGYRLMDASQIYQKQSRESQRRRITKFVSVCERAAAVCSFDCVLYRLRVNQIYLKLNFKKEHKG